MRNLPWRFKKYKNIVFFRGGNSLYGVDLEKRLLINLIENLPRAIAAFDIYDPTAIIQNGPKKYCHKVRGLLNNPRLIVLMTDGVIAEYDIDSYGTKLKVNNKMKWTAFEDSTWHAISITSQFIAVSEKDKIARRAILIIDRTESSVLHTIKMSQGTLNLQENNPISQLEFFETNKYVFLVGACQYSYLNVWMISNKQVISVSQQEKLNNCRLA